VEEESSATFSAIVAAVHGLKHAVTAGLWSAAVSLLAPPARAVPAAELTFSRGLGAESCPDEAELKRQVSARLGEDPFCAAPTQRFRAEVVLAGEKLVGHVALLDETGKATGLREFEGENGCAEIVSALALAVSLAVNPELAVVAPPPPAEPDTKPEAETPAPPSATPAPRTEPEAPAPSPHPDEGAEPEQLRGLADPFDWAVGAFGLGAVGAGPGPTVGAALALRGRRGAWSVAFEGRLDAASTAAAGKGEVSGALAAGQVAGCGHFGFASACGLLVLGSLSLETRGMDVPGSDSGLYTAAGARLGAEARLAQHWLAQARVDVLATLTPVRAVRNGTERLWEAEAVPGVLGVGLVAEIP
jgi:hypothetical protein